MNWISSGLRFEQKLLGLITHSFSLLSRPREAYPEWGTKDVTLQTASAWCLWRTRRRTARSVSTVNVQSLLSCCPWWWWFVVRHRKIMESCALLTIFHFIWLKLSSLVTIRITWGCTRCYEVLRGTEPKLTKCVQILTHRSNMQPRFTHWVKYITQTLF